DGAERAVEVVILGDLDRGEAVAVGRAADADRLRPRIGNSDLVAAGETPLERGLEAVVMRVADGREEARLDGAAVPRGEDTAGIAAVDRGVVELAEAGLVDLPRRHIAG